MLVEIVQKLREPKRKRKSTAKILNLKKNVNHDENLSINTLNDLGLLFTASIIRNNHKMNNYYRLYPPSSINLQPIAHTLS